MYYSVSTCYENINSTITKKTQYRNAKAKIQSAQSVCSSDVTTFTTTVSKITGDLLTMKKADSFEGEMADKLSTDVSNFKNDLDVAQGKADAIATATSSQIAMIDAKIAELDSDEAMWRRRLAEAQAYERRLQQERMGL